MSAPNIVLNPNQVLLTQTASLLSIDASVTGFQFGAIALVSDVCERYEVADVVLFDPKDAKQLLFSNEVYFLTTEDKIFFKENPPV